MRYEYKYYVPAFQLAALRGMLHAFVQPDRYAAHLPDHQYTVRSIYFDTPDLEMYHTKQEHIAHRMKVRLRGYNLGNDDPSVFFEIKRKYEGPILKHRAAMPFSAVKDIFEGIPVDHFLPQTNTADNVRRFFYQVYTKRLRPVVTVIYEREAYISKLVDPGNDLRISLDKNLRSVPFPAVSELFMERDLRYPIDNQFILEIKFNQYCPAWLKPIVSTLQLQKAPASKYVLCMDSQPGIQANRYRSISLRPLNSRHRKSIQDRESETL